MRATSRPARTRLALDTYGDADAIITNPPYTRPLMHALIEHFARILPTWLLLETDWASTKQAAPFMPIVHRHRVGGPPALVRRDDHERQAELCMVPLRRSPLGRAEVSCAWVGAGVVARQPLRAMRQGLSAAAIRLQVLLGHLSAARPSHSPAPRQTRGVDPLGVAARGDFVDTDHDTDNMGSRWCRRRVWRASAKRHSCDTRHTSRRRSVVN